MNIDADLRERLQGTFGRLALKPAVFPAPVTLSRELEGMIPREPQQSRNVDADIAAHFSTAAVEIWLRSVHSFLVSAALTTSSPIWCSVSGYYSSHYAVRGIAHLLGYFQLFRRGLLVQLQSRGTGFRCTYHKKNRSDAEHKMYWKIVKESTVFAGDPFFAENIPHTEESDIRHRNHANYADHIFQYPNFHPLSEQEVCDRISYIASCSFDTNPLPRFSKFPDLEFVQIVAYHRIVKFRRLLDEALAKTNRFWDLHRDPSFARDYMTYQLQEGRGADELSVPS